MLPLLVHADVVFFSREFVKRHLVTADDASKRTLPQRADEGSSKRARTERTPTDADDADAIRGLRRLRERAAHLPKKALWVCAWGATGAFALEVRSRRTLRSPPSPLRTRFGCLWSCELRSPAAP